MAVGDCVLTNLGTHTLSGASVLTIVNAQNLGAKQASGAQIFLIPSEGGQVQAFKLTVTGW